MNILPSAAINQNAASNGPAQVVGEAEPIRFHIGEPIEIAWQAPKTHSCVDFYRLPCCSARTDRLLVSPLALSRKDWIGIYRLGGTVSSRSYF